MIRNFFARLIPLIVIAVLVLWFFRAPESVAGLITGLVDLVVAGADSLGRFTSALSPALSGLL